MSQSFLVLPSKKIRDIRGERFGRLLVESLSHVATNKGKNAYWTCLCDCGKHHIVSSGSLRSGSCVSCGCYGKEISKKLIKNTHHKGKHLYFIRSGPYVKIGRTNDINRRLSQLRSMNPYKVSLVNFYEDKGELEHRLHEKYKEYHHQGEWFLLDDKECEIVDIGEFTNE